MSGPDRPHIRVLIAEASTLVRDALATTLALADDINVVAQVGNSNAILPAVLADCPDVAVVSTNLPGIDGIVTAERLRAELAACQVLIINVHGQPFNLRRALEANVAGYLLQDVNTSELTGAIRKVASGQQIFHSKRLLNAWNHRSSPLTAREIEVLRLTAQGENPQEIATSLRLSVGTVRNYLAAIVTKLNARNRVDALRIASELDWLA